MSVLISNSEYLTKSELADDLPIIAWQSVLKISDITASGSFPLRIASNLWSPDTATFWQADSGGATLTLSNSNAAQVDYIAIAKHNLGSAGVTYLLLSSDDGINYIPMGATRTPLDDSPIVEYFNPTQKQFFKIQFGDGVPVIAHVRLGKALVLTQSVYVGHAPATLSKVVNRVSQSSSVGQFLGQVVLQSSHESSLKQENVPADFVRQKIVPFIAHANGSRVDDGTARGSFFFAWRPAEYPDEVIYAWTEDKIRPENQRSNGMMSFSFNMDGIS